MFFGTGLTRLGLIAAVIAAAVGLRAESSLLGGQLPPLPPASPPAAILAKLDPLLVAQLSRPTGQSRIVATANDGVSLDALTLLIQQVGGVTGRRLSIINSVAATVPNLSLAVLSLSGIVQHLAADRLAGGAMERTGPTTGASAVRQELGVDGSGIGVAVVDSGVTAWHDDLADPAAPDTQRVAQFVDLVNNASDAYDDYGHGTHVAGIIAGNGFDSSGARSGIAPAATLLVVKALDSSGKGRISDVIAALDYVVAHRADFNIRVINLSVAAGVYESYYSDPLTRAAKRAVDQGIVVVAAAGNAGRNQNGAPQYGGITAPGNAPWVLTVGASSTMGTIDRSDDTMAAFSSRGPTAVDRLAKPDLVAPGVGTESLSAPGSTFYNSMSPYLLSGTVDTPSLPYLSLSGTSMAAPVVSGTVALMLQANPALTPNAVKAILQYTSQVYSSYGPLSEGAGFLNARGAVELAAYLASPTTTAYPPTDGWSGQLIWGNYRIQGGRLTADATAWLTGVVWGDATTSSGQNVTWGVMCATACDQADAVWTTWGATCLDAQCSSVQWGSGDAENVVWGTACDGGNCSGRGWSSAYGTSSDDGVVWGSSDSDAVVWGSNDGSDAVVWGSNCSDSSCDPVVWPGQ
jgi:serine protease AprX